MTAVNVIRTPKSAKFIMFSLRPIYTVRLFLTIVARYGNSARYSRHGKIVYNFHDIKLPVATIVLSF